jgi:putative ABC transport system substrate-binding protein
MYEDDSFVRAGGLISFGPSIAQMFRRAAAYVDKILNGAKPADLPVEQPTAFDLAINLETAKALGVAVPPEILDRADEVIADSGEDDRLIQPKVITGSGDRDHARHAGWKCAW